jgi:ankyrin repeat protein
MKSLRSYIWRVASWTYVMDKNIALRHAARRGASNAVRVLLEAGADVHGAEDAALQKASANGHADTVKVLLAAGANVHALGDKALRRAAGNGHTDTVKVLNEWMAREAKKPAEGSETI